MQPYSGGLEGILGECLNTTYNAIHYAEEHGIDNRREMKGFYRSLKDTKLPSCYKVAVIARACQVLASRKKSDKRGTRLRYPKPLKPVVCITSGFFITMKGRLFIPLRGDEYFDVQLGHYVMEIVEGRR